MLSAPMEPGQTLLGKYRIERVLGVGGMGVVVAATHLELDETVAIKFLHDETAQHPDAITRLLREARAAVKIKSEHVGRVIDVGKLDGGGAPFIVMEYLNGRNLAEVLESEGPFGIDVAIEWVLHACEAIAHAHALGIVHRDIKPANLMLTYRPDGAAVVKVLDFGISKFTAGYDRFREPNITGTSAMLGSPTYMSPEQMTSTRGVDGRTDIWALGGTLYEFLAGQAPFTAATMPQLCAKILSEPHERLRTFRPLVPRGLEAIVDRCLEKNPERRFADVQELAMALAAFAPARTAPILERITALSRFSKRPGSSRDEPQFSGNREIRATADSAELEHARSGRPRYVLGLLWALGFVVAVGGVAFWARHRSEAARTRPPGAAAVDLQEPRAPSGSMASRAPDPTPLPPATMKPDPESADTRAAMKPDPEPADTRAAMKPDPEPANTRAAKPSTMGFRSRPLPAFPSASSPTGSAGVRSRETNSVPSGTEPRAEPDLFDGRK